LGIFGGQSRPTASCAPHGPGAPGKIGFPHDAHLRRFDNADSTAQLPLEEINAHLRKAFTLPVDGSTQTSTRAAYSALVSYCASLAANALQSGIALPQHHEDPLYEKPEEPLFQTPADIKQTLLDIAQNIYKNMNGDFPTIEGARNTFLYAKMNYREQDSRMGLVARAMGLRRCHNPHSG
jgi:hypothetical protein